MKTPSMKIPIVYEKRVKTVGDVVTELLKLDQKSKVGNEWPDEDTGKVSIKLGL
jgi:hypothetical protein